MEYRDTLYGTWTLPDYIEQLLHTKEMQRLRGISQSVLPNSVLPGGALPDRCRHGLGAAYLADCVLRVNPHIVKQLAMLLRVSVLYHDAGNTAFSHNAEVFLHRMFGYDGESFLTKILEGSETEQIFDSLGIDVADVVGMVTGNMKPFSDVLNGSIDIDNLDNIARFDHALNLGTPLYDGLRLAGSLRAMPGWYLCDSYAEAMKWKRARVRVYDYVYSEPHLSVARMINRAIGIAFNDGQLDMDFFLCNDEEGIQRLLKINHRSGRLIEDVLAWRWYPLFISCDYNILPDTLKEYYPGWNPGHKLADMICRKFFLPDHFVCAYLNKDKGHRKIDLKFVNTATDRISADEDKSEPIYRLRIYLHPDIDERIKSSVYRYFAPKLNKSLLRTAC